MTSPLRTFLACAFVLWPIAALAQNSGTPAEQDACTPDVFNLCQDYIPNEGPIVACLQAKRRQLSTACSAVIFPKAQTATRHGAKRHHHLTRHK